MRKSSKFQSKFGALLITRSVKGNAYQSGGISLGGDSCPTFQISRPPPFLADTLAPVIPTPPPPTSSDTPHPSNVNKTRFHPTLASDASSLSLEKDSGATRLGATGPRVSERKIFPREILRKGLRKPPRGTLVMKMKFTEGDLSETLSEADFPLGDSRSCCP